MKSARVVELGGFACVAAALHVLAFGFVSRSEGAASAGAAGDAIVSLEASNAQVAAMVEAWEKPTVPQPVVQLSPEPLQMDMPEIDLPTVEDAPALPDLAALDKPKLETPPEVQEPPPEQPPEKEVSELAPDESVRPTERPDKPPPEPRKKVETQPAKKSAVNSAAQAAQRAAGSGNRGARGDSGRSQAATLSNAQVENLRGRWGAAIRQRIERHKRYPSGARGATGQAVVRLKVSSSGQLMGVSLVRSSGNAAIDQAAVSAVKRTGRFPKAPKGLNEASLTFSLPMSFSRR